jgi:hypothetical protein
MPDAHQTSLEDEAWPWGSVRPSDHVLAARDGGGCVLVDLMAERYFSLNHTGAFVWQLLAEGRPIGEVANRMANEYQLDDASCVADLCSVIEQLLAHNLVVAQ